MAVDDISPLAARDRRHPRIAIAIASAGRPGILKETVRHMTTLRPAADEILVCTPNESDAGDLPDVANLRKIIGRRGSSSQRNDLLAAAEDADFVLFFDDDFFPAPDFIERTMAIFDRDDDVVIATGHVVVDGIHGAGLSVPDAHRALARATHRPDSVIEAYNAYGCNMAVRMSTVRAHAVRFDENLPLYGWLEDLDFSRRMAAHGRSVRAHAMIGVHLGIKLGRQPGRRLGYSQIANPWYLVGKRTMSRRRAFTHMNRNLLANLVGTLRRDPAIDRKGRLVGNVLAIVDILRRRSAPTRVLAFDDARKPARPMRRAGLKNLDAERP